MFDHLWSLAIEEQFYLVWPLVLVAVWRWAPRPTRTLRHLSASAIGVAFVTMVVLYDGVDPTRVYMGTDTRAASLLAGALAATGPCRRVVARLSAPVRATCCWWCLPGCVGWSWVAIDGASSALLYRGGLLAIRGLCAW